MIKKIMLLLLLACPILLFSIPEKETMDSTTELRNWGITATFTGAGTCAGTGCAIFCAPLGINQTAACLWCTACGLCAGLLVTEVDRQGREEQKKRTHAHIKAVGNSLRLR